MQSDATAPAPATSELAQSPLEAANFVIASLRAELEALQAAPTEPGPGNSRGGLVRVTLDDPEKFKVDRSMFGKPVDAVDAKVKQRQQQAYAKAIADGRPIDFGAAGQPSLAEQLSASNPGPYLRVTKTEHKSEDGETPGYTVYEQQYSIYGD